MGEYRTERVGHLIQEKIGMLIVQGKIKDPRVDPLLSVTRVEVSRDFSWAEVYISTPGKNLAQGVLGLQSAAGFIQSQLGREMRIRQIPHLRFHEDKSIREGFEMIKKIDALTSQESPPEIDAATNKESQAEKEK